MKHTIPSKNYIVLFLFYLLQVSIAFAQPSTIIDSLITVINQSEEEARLDAYYNACLDSGKEYDLDRELALLYAYQAEAQTQNNIKHEMMARTMKLYSFYNGSVHDSIFFYVDNDLKMFERHEQWDYYYSCRSLMVECYRYSNRMQSALLEAKSMYEYATTQDHSYGKGVAAYLIASCHQSMNRNTLAVEFFEEAETHMLKESNVGQLHNMYGIAWESFLIANEEEKLLGMLDRWEDMWKEYCRKNQKKFSDVARYYIVCVCVRAHIYTKNNDLVAARSELDEAAILAGDNNDISRALWLKEEARYAEAIGDYYMALDFLDKCQELQTAYNNKIAVVSTQGVRANILLKLGQAEMAAQIYSELLIKKEEMMQLDMAAQLDDFSSIYKVETLKEEKIQLELWLLIIGITSGLMLLLFALFFFYQKKIHIKNQAIISQYQKQKNTENVIEQMLDSDSAVTSTNKEMELFMDIKKLLKNKDLLLNPDLDRNLLATKLGTNHTYISKAILTGAAVNISTYINQVRIDYACELLKQMKSYTVAEIQVMCGFQSRSHFYRAFKSHMHMSPTDFQKELNN